MSCLTGHLPELVQTYSTLYDLAQKVYLNKRWDLGWRREMQNLISSLLSWGTRVWYSPYSIYPCLYIVYPLPCSLKQLSTERFPLYRFGPFFDWSSKYFSTKFLLPALACTGLNANIGFAADVNTIWRLWERNKNVFKTCLVENLLIWPYSLLFHKSCEDNLSILFIELGIELFIDHYLLKYYLFHRVSVLNMKATRESVSTHFIHFSFYLN